jgi:hypothetical protein
LLITLDYQQWIICSGSETATDGSFKPLHMTFSVVVFKKKIKDTIFCNFIFEMSWALLSMSNLWEVTIALPSVFVGFLWDLWYGGFLNVVPSLYPLITCNTINTHSMFWQLNNTWTYEHFMSSLIIYGAHRSIVIHLVIYLAFG